MGPYIEPHQHAFRIGQIADNLSGRLGNRTDQRRDRQDLIAGRELRLLKQVDNFHPVVSGQMLLANPFKIAQSLKRSRRLPRHVKPQVVLLSSGYPLCRNLAFRFSVCFPVLR